MPRERSHGRAVQAAREGAMLFADRRDAGRKLGAALGLYRARNPLVLALPRGGVPVACEIAEALAAPLDVLIVRKVGAPDNPEFGLGAVVDGTPPVPVIDPDLVRLVGATPAYMQAEIGRQIGEIARRRALYPAPKAQQAEGRCTIVVDDGIATGGTMRAALVGLRIRHPSALVVAVPVAPPDAIAALSAEAEVVCLHVAPDLGAVGSFYRDFAQTEDEEVVQLLRLARGARRNCDARE